MMKNNLKYLFPLVAGFSGTVMAQSTTANLPNVVYIMADDLGIGDLGCYGQRQIKTVNIDGIAQNGMKLCSIIPELQSVLPHAVPC